MLARMRHKAARRHTHDAVKPSADPTGTAAIRRRYTTLIAIRWRRLLSEVRSVIVAQDMLGLDPAKQTVLGMSLAGLPHDGRTRAFQNYLDQTLSRIILENDTAYLDPMIEAAYRKGMTRAQRLSRAVTPPDMREVISNLQQLTLVEMQGIVEAFSQRVVRLGVNAQLDRVQPKVLAASIKEAVEKIGIVRSKATVSVMVVKAHAQATLDTFEAAGVTHVNGVPETVRPMRVRRRTSDEAIFPAPTRRGESASTIGRIRREERRVERAFEATLVEVQTAEDDLVCPQCEEISADGPYTIDQARSLIPAHPECRCSFVPEGDEGFEFEEEDD
jgi:hypothetical protein